MAPKIIDEQSFNAREQELIDAAIGLIQQQGVENITIDKLVAAVPYSKGTIYKHFIGKEDLLLAISNRALGILSDLFFRASAYQGCTRERMLLLNFAYLIYAILHPSLFETMLCAKSPTIYGKASDDRIQQQETMEIKLMGSIFSIVEEGLRLNNLKLPAYMDIQQVCFANWSLGYGTISLLSAQTNPCEGSKDLYVERELFNHNNLMFDGLQWAPLTHEKDYKQALQEALNDVYAMELAKMKQLGRELKF